LVDFPADPHCGAAWDDRESASGSSCGLGAELVPALLALAALRRRRRRQ